MYLKVEDSNEEFFNTASITYMVDFPTHRAQPNIKDLHSTVLFLGEMDREKYSVQDLLHILKPVETNAFQYVNTTGWDLFGLEKNIPVITLETTDEMRRIREESESLLAEHGIHSPSEFPYSPHVTVDTETRMMGNLPRWVLLRPAQLWVGKSFLGPDEVKSSITTTKERF